VRSKHGQARPRRSGGGSSGQWRRQGGSRRMYPAGAKETAMS